VRHTKNEKESGAEISASNAHKSAHPHCLKWSQWKLLKLNANTEKYLNVSTH